MNGFKQRLIVIYKPKPAPWKRRVLWALSVSIAALCIVGVWAQIQYQFANPGIWAVIGVFGVLSAAGIIAAAWGDDWWVALLLGGI